jgi:glutamate synthase (NADPH/NADH) small chain
MGKVTGFMEYERLEQEHEPSAQRKTHFREFIKPLGQKEAKQQAARCMDCGTPFCTFSCPLHNVAPEFNDLVYQGKWSDAYEVLSSTNNFPEFTSRVCPALCENGCVLNFTDKSMGVKSIERAIITHAFNQGWVNPCLPEKRSGKSVAVIGSGPAGLACAQQLARKGHAVTVFEKNIRAGGLLRFGIPDFKLDKSLIDRRIAQMEAEGVQFRLSTYIGDAQVPHGVWSDAERIVDPQEILRDFDAVVLAIGSEEPRDLKIPGREGKGIYFALEYLGRQNRKNAGLDPRGFIDANGKKVLVIGGGDTGSDCLGTALRQGAASVLQVDLGRRPSETYDKSLVWPEWPMILRTSSSQEEGGDRDWAVMSREFLLNEKGEVRAVRAVRSEPVKDPVSGRFVPKAIEGSEFEIECDLVFLAMGFAHPNQKVLESFKLSADKRGNILAQTEGEAPFATSVEKVFATGDCRKGQSLVVHSLSEGRRCAEAVDLYLKG